MIIPKLISIFYMGGGEHPDMGIIGLGDFDADGDTDLLWKRGSTGSNPHISRGWRAFGFEWILSCLSVGIALSTLWAQKTPLPPQFARMSWASAERHRFDRQLR